MGNAYPLLLEDSLPSNTTIPCSVPPPEELGKLALSTLWCPRSGNIYQVAVGLREFQHSPPRINTHTFKLFVDTCGRYTTATVFSREIHPDSFFLTSQTGTFHTGEVDEGLKSNLFIAISFRNLHLDLLPHLNVLSVESGDSWNLRFNICSSFYNLCFQWHLSW